MKKDIREIASILDEEIAKAHSRSKKQIRKGLSFDPFSPHEMGSDSPYYCPYMQLGDGSYVPFPEETWAPNPTERTISDYRTVRQFYNVVGENFKPGPASQQFRTFRKSIAKPIKSPQVSTTGQAVPVGAIHTYKDGQKYRKVSDGVWVPEKRGPQHSLLHHDKKKRAEAHGEIERHAGHVKKIEDTLRQKKDRAKMIEDAKKQVLRHIRGTIGKLFDGPMPDGLKPDYDLRRKMPKQEKK